MSCNHSLEIWVLSGVLAAVLAGCGAGSEGGASREGESDGSPSAAAGLGNARAALGANPAGVPEDFVITPAGYMHPSCVIPIGTGDTVLEDGSIQGADGSVQATEPCGFPRFDANGAPLTTETGSLIRALSVADGLSFTGWVESAHDDSMGALSFLSTSWTVPSSPSVNAGRRSSTSPAFSRWSSVRPSIPSCSRCSPGGAASGKSRAGIVAPKATPTRDWVVNTADVTTGVESRLDTTAYGNVMGWAFGGVLEVYDVSACNQYPPTGSVTFANLELRSTSNAPVTPNWRVDVTPREPQCGYGVDAADPSSVTVFASP